MKPFLMLIGTVFVITAQSGAAETTTSNTPLDALVASVQEARKKELARNKEREQTFLNAHQQQKALLKEAKQTFAALQEKNNKFKQSLSEDKETLAELEQEQEALLRESRLLTEGIKDEAGRLSRSFSHSVLPAFNADRSERINQLALNRAVPSREQLYQYWEDLNTLLADSSRITRTTTAITRSTGDPITAPVTFIGPFTAVSNGNFLRYYPETSQLGIPVKQPRFNLRIDAEGFEQSHEPMALMAIDPGRGRLLEQLETSPSIIERIDQGGFIAWLIIALGALGAGLLITRHMSLIHESRRIRQQQVHMDELSRSNALGRVLMAWEKHRQQGSPENLELRLDEAIMAEIPRLESWQSVIKLMAAIAPMLGLLGTITGMIRTFQGMSANAGQHLMAVGISQALITTAIGLMVAIPLLLGHAFLTNRSRQLVLLLDRQAAGLMAEHLEKKAC